MSWGAGQPERSLSSYTLLGQTVIPTHGNISDYGLLFLFLPLYLILNTCMENYVLWVHSIEAGIFIYIYCIFSYLWLNIETENKY